jgi:hypothetical protein
MIAPGFAYSPAKSFTPSLLPIESLVLAVDPPAFLCAIYLLFNKKIKISSNFYSSNIAKVFFYVKLILQY